MNCIRNCLARSLPWMLIAIVFAIVAGIIAATGGLTIVISTITIGVTGSAILAALAVFGLLVAIIAFNCVIQCATRPPSRDEAPPSSGSGLGNAVAPDPVTPPDPTGGGFR